MDGRPRVQMNNWGIGSTHVITRLGNTMLKRWGFWSPYFTVLLSKIYPIKQIHHNHEGTFVSFLLWGSYEEEVDNQGKLYKRQSKWFNVVKSYEYHRVICTKPVWTLLFMGPRKQDVTAKHKGKVIPYTRLTKSYR
jgi:hypothetical protein